MVPVVSMLAGLRPFEGMSAFPDLIIVGRRARWEYVGPKWLVCGNPNNQVVTITALAGGGVTDE
jgi:hypothetical protein